MYMNDNNVIIIPYTFVSWAGGDARTKRRRRVLWHSFLEFQTTAQINVIMHLPTGCTLDEVLHEQSRKKCHRHRSLQRRTTVFVPDYIRDEMIT